MRFDKMEFTDLPAFLEDWCGKSKATLGSWEQALDAFVWALAMNRDVAEVLAQEIAVKRAWIEQDHEE